MGGACRPVTQEGNPALRLALAPRLARVQDGAHDENASDCLVACKDGAKVAGAQGPVTRDPLPLAPASPSQSSSAITQDDTFPRSIYGTQMMPSRVAPSIMTGKLLP